MILLFPDTDTLRLALTSSIVPADVTLAPAAVSTDDQKRLYVESSTNLSRTVTKNLDRIGVKGSKRHGSDAPREVTSWLEILPVAKETGTPNVSSQAAVLFDLGSADDLPTLVTEMLRLGNDRQGFRWFTGPGGKDDKRVLLRVIGPPYYTLLRALDRTASGTAGDIRAYLEAAPRVWVEVGYAHPLANQIRVADGQQLLIRADREWLFLDDAPFQDVYDILHFQLPTSPVEWAAAKAPKKLTVPLRLTAGNAADLPELWVVRDDALAQLDALVRDSTDRLTQRLMFAVATDPGGTRTVILRTRPSKLAPPALPLDSALGFKPYWKLPNLFLPVGRRLQPTLRRDAVRRLLADDADQVVWLYPDEQGGFTPESVPDAAFRSLEDWVDYVIEAEQAPLAAWIEATRFDFDHFVCRDSGGPKTRTDKGDKEPHQRDETNPSKTNRSPASQTKSSAKGKGTGRATETADFLSAPVEEKPPSEWVKRRAELEDQFRSVDGPLDAPRTAGVVGGIGRRQLGVEGRDRGGRVLAERPLGRRPATGRVGRRVGPERTPGGRGHDPRGRVRQAVEGHRVPIRLPGGRGGFPLAGEPAARAGVGDRPVAGDPELPGTSRRVAAGAGGVAGGIPDGPTRRRGCPSGWPAPATASSSAC